MDFNLIDFTEKWFGVDWRKEGGSFKEWVRGMHLHSINNGWLDVPRSEVTWLIHRVQHVISWIPYLWSDYDFDHVYIWRMQREKIKRIREHITEHNIFVGCEKVCRDMKIAEEILTRLIEDDYIMDEMEKHWEKFGHIKYKKLPSGGSISLPSENTEESDKDFKRIVDREAYLRNQDMAFLGEHLKKHIRCWWD